MLKDVNIIVKTILKVLDCVITVNDYFRVTELLILLLYIMTVVRVHSQKGSWQRWNANFNSTDTHLIPEKSCKGGCKLL